MIDDESAMLQSTGVLSAVASHDTAALYDWLMGAISYQGVSDTVVETYIAQHGNATYTAVAASLVPRAHCTKLVSYWHYSRCGYRKSAQRCAEPNCLNRCPVPRLPLRNGGLNQTAYSLFLFMRDVAEDDFVAWLDKRIADSKRATARQSTTSLCDTIIEPLRHVHGISDKVLNMSLASLFLAAGSQRPDWMILGANMIAIDSLVHNWLHRSGILLTLDQMHPYGPRCYSKTGCVDIVRNIARRIDARAFNPTYPKLFPRFVQKAVWRFCSQNEFNQCNGNRVDDHDRCTRSACPLFCRCERVALKQTAA